MSAIKGLTGKLNLQHLFFLLLMFSGIIPLTIISLLLISQNREVLETQEKTNLTRSAMSLSVELNDYFSWNRRQLALLGISLAAAPNSSSLAGRMREPWVREYLEEFMAQNPQLLALRILDAEGVGPTLAPSDLPAEVVKGLVDAFEEVKAEGGPVFRFAPLGESGDSVAVVALRIVPSRPGQAPFYVEGVLRLRLMESVFLREAQGKVAVFLVTQEGQLLWSEAASPEMQRAVMESPLVRDFVSRPLNLTAEYSLYLNGERYDMVGQVSPVAETGWGVLVHKPVSAAFAAVRRMILNTVLSAVVLIGLSLVIAMVAARRLSRPIQELAKTSQEIAAGNFGRRAATTGPAAEIRQLAISFNRMSGHVERYIDQLRRAARLNRELFINSIRAFAAAIDAKDPYTRGHSERVANLSRTIARHMELPDEIQHQVWVGALLHDVGKIGINDSILSKGGVLTPEEYEQMKLHTVIGMEILSPIEQLREMIPAVRWHHESWDGTGYPDGLKGEKIPLLARIVAVADSFDAITVSRPYQRFRPIDEAVRMITNLTGRRFDSDIVNAFLTAHEAGQIRVRQKEPQGEPAESATGA